MRDPLSLQAEQIHNLMDVYACKDRLCQGLASVKKPVVAILITGTALVVVYCGSLYYITTINKILSEQLPFVENDSVQIIINIFGVPGTAIRYLAQIASLIQIFQTYSNKPLKHILRQLLLPLPFALCAAYSAFILAEIQIKEYDLDLSLATPGFLFLMEGVEALVGGLDTDNIKKLYEYIKIKLQCSRYTGDDTEADVTPEDNHFPSLPITMSLCVIHGLLILFSFVTVLDELRRNLLSTQIAKFVISSFGNMPQVSLDFETFSGILQIKCNEISPVLALFALTLAFFSSLLSFMMAYEFLGISDHYLAIGVGFLAMCPKTLTAFKFIYHALEATQKKIVDDCVVPTKACLLEVANQRHQEIAAGYGSFRNPFLPLRPSPIPR